MEENGRHFLRVTYSLVELDQFLDLAAAGAGLSRKHSFVNGLEVRWPQSADGDGFTSLFPLAVADSMQQDGRPCSPSH